MGFPVLCVAVPVCACDCVLAVSPTAGRQGTAAPEAVDDGADGADGADGTVTVVLCVVAVCCCCLCCFQDCLWIRVVV